MRLERPFYQLPVFFDAERLQAEVAGLPAEAWVPHPDRVPGNFAARLITEGGAETDGYQGQMAPTPWLEAMPYLRQVLAGFGVVWSRSRLMRLGPGVGVPRHSDIKHHWHTRVRMHIPIFTWPEVRFHCDGEAVHMAPGEAWIFDNWRAHFVENQASADRIHLVADTTGTAAFWEFACGRAPPREQWKTVTWDPDRTVELLTERNWRPPVMSAAEVAWLIDDLRSELALSVDEPDVRSRGARFDGMLESFVLDWRQLCALHGLDGRGRADFLRLMAAAREAARRLSDGLVMRTNGVGALAVFEERVLQHLVVDERPANPQDGA